MKLLKRVVRRSKRAAQDIDDIRLRRVLRARDRAPREVASLDDLDAGAILVVVAHPDDECIAAGALMSRAARAGVVCVTTGAPRKDRLANSKGFRSWIEYGEARRRESQAALALLERELTPSISLGLADQEATFDLVTLARHMTTPLKSGFTHVVTHAFEGGHPDHDAVAFAVHAACALLRREGMTPPTIVEAPLYSAPQGEYVYGEFLPHPDAGPTLRRELSPAERDLKTRMFGCYASQEITFDDFQVETESFRVAPRYHFAGPPHPGDVGFNQFNWTVNGRTWRAKAWKAMRDLDLLEDLA